MIERIFKAILVLFFFITIQCTYISLKDDFPFEKKVWSFWDAEDFDQAPILVQACYAKIKMAAEKAGFEYILLNSKNAHQYITNYEERILKVREKSVQEGLQFFADLVRINVLHEHGGIWMDITEILINDFDWLLNIKSEKYRNLITNRFTEEPDALLFYFPAYQNSAEHRIQSPNNKREKLLYNEIPGFEVWFFATKKNNSLIGEIKETYTNFTQTPYQELFRRFIEEEIYMHNQDGVGYLSFNYAISYVLQKRQKELDKSIEIFGDRLTVYEYYKLWGLSALLGPLTWTTYESVDPIHFMDRPKEYFEEKGWMFNFLVKIAGNLKEKFNEKITLFQSNELKSFSSFENFIKSNPSENDCKEIIFFVEGSLLSSLFVNTTYVVKDNIKMISEKSNEEWEKYCLERYQINKEFGESRPIIFDLIDSLLFFSNRQQILWYEAHNTVNFDKDYASDSIEQIKDWLFVNSASFGFWLKFFIDGTIWFLLQYFIFSYFSKKYNKHESGILKLNQQKDEKSFMTSLAIILCNTISLYEYHMIDYFGERDRLFETFVSVTLIFILQNFIERRVKNTTNEICYDVTLPFISFRTTFTVFSLMRSNKNRLTFYSIIIGLTGPCLLRLYERMALQKDLKTSFFSRIIYSLTDKGLHRQSLVILFFLIWMIPNMKYIQIGDHYALAFIPVILFVVVIILFLELFFNSIRKASIIEILRISLLGILTFIIYFMLPLRNEVIEHNFQRMLWTFLTVTVFQSIYLQIGWEYLIVKNQLLHNFSIERFINIFICFGILLIELVFGSFSSMASIPNHDRLVYFEGLLLGTYNFFMILYLTLKKLEKEIDHKQIEKFERIEMCTEMEEEISE